MPQDDAPEELTPRWYSLFAHPKQIDWMNSKARFNVVPAGRRSGKTERAKRKLVRRALMGSEFENANFFCAAPTRDQAKRIWWDDIKRMIPPDIMLGRPRESELIVKLINGSSIHVIGMDKPERIEGSPWDGGVMDEYANMKPHALQLHVLPALADRNGWCDFIGVPEGRNHYYDLYLKAMSDASGEWRAFTWVSADIIPAEKLAVYKDSMDELSFQQEFEASFLNFQGRAYYTFDRNIHCSSALVYNQNLPLVLCFDFNVSPGVCAVIQEFPELPGTKRPGTGIIGEVYIPANSNTIYVCNKIRNDWAKHQGLVYCYGDATGGNPGSAKVTGSDWDIIRRELRQTFGDRLRMNVPAGNPLERSRVNAVNTRFLCGPKEKPIIQMMAHPENAKNAVRDFEGVRCIEGGSGEIDKLSDKTLTHISDAIGYYIHYKFPVAKAVGQRDF